jgi:hypothetical protein
MLFVLVGAMLVLSADSAYGQKVWYSGNVEATMRSLENNSDNFAKSLDVALDYSELDGTKTEDEINKYVHDWEESLDMLKEKVDDQEAAPVRYRAMLNHARNINRFMSRYNLAWKAEQDWLKCRKDINALGNVYRITVKW